MTLDDRSLREHLVRRAKAGATDIGALRDSVLAQLSDGAHGSPWYRQSRIRSTIGLAAAAVVVALVGLALLPEYRDPGPAMSASPSAFPFASATPGDRPALEYPADRAMTAAELEELLGDNPADRASIVVIADVELVVLDATCVGECPAYLIRTASGQIAVFDGGDRIFAIAGPQAFRVRADGDLDVLGPVREGPEGLSWTLPQLTTELTKLRAAEGANPVPFLYLVDAVRVVSEAAFRCFAPPPAIDVRFGCGSGSVSWLVPAEASVSTAGSNAPPGSLRVPNVTGIRPSGDAFRQRGFWLLDPWVTPEDCFLCPSAGAADLLGRVLTFRDLGSTAAPGTSPAGG